MKVWNNWSSYYIKLSLGYHEQKRMNKLIHYPLSPHLWSHFSNPFYLFRPHSESGTLKKYIFFQLKLQSLHQSSKLYYNHSRFYSHSMLVQVTWDFLPISLDFILSVRKSNFNSVYKIIFLEYFHVFLLFCFTTRLRFLYNSKTYNNTVVKSYIIFSSSLF